MPASVWGLGSALVTASPPSSLILATSHLGDITALVSSPAPAIPRFRLPALQSKAYDFPRITGYLYGLDRVREGKLKWRLEAPCVIFPLHQPRECPVLVCFPYRRVILGSDRPGHPRYRTGVAFIDKRPGPRKSGDTKNSNDRPRVIFFKTLSFSSQPFGGQSMNYALVKGARHTVQFSSAGQKIKLTFTDEKLRFSDKPFSLSLTREPLN